MKTPILDNRTKTEIMEQIARLAAEYVPEWRGAGDPADPGAALAELFGEMFCQTVDRFNAVPQKLYTEFLNLLGVRAPPATPAAGLVRFQVCQGVEEAVPVPAGSLLYARDDEDGHIVYETRRAIEATPARLEAVYYVDAQADVIQTLDLTREQPFFAPVEGENLQRHCFLVSQNDVLNLRGPCEIEVQLMMEAGFLTEDAARRLADPRFAVWSWRSETGPVPFDQVRCRQDRLLLTKTAPGRLLPEENGQICLCCEMAAGEGIITLDGVRLQSAPLRELEADATAHNDVPISQEEGGYCFGRMPAPYDLFYIRSDTAFSKRGAEARLRLDIRPVVYTEVDSAPQYDFSRRIIDKNSGAVILPDDVFVREVVWEYYNGRGWAGLAVRGNENPFSGREEGPLETRFTVPEDIAPVVVNAQEGLFIRARVVGVENSLSMVPRWILPFVKTVVCSWRYGGGRPVEWIGASNNGREQALEDAAGMGPLRFEIYANLEARPRSMYLCFDRPLRGTPVSIMFELAGESGAQGKLLYEFWDGTRFEPLRTLDGTRSLAHSGPVYLYLTRPAVWGGLFGRKGCWLRVSRTSGGERRPPVIRAVRLNVVPAVQQQRAADQYFSVGFYEAGKVLQLLEAPVMRCEIWVDETGSVSAAELAELERTRPEDVRAAREGNAVTGCKIRWREAASLSQGGPEDRVYELDSHTGRVRFGDGRNGRVPPAGFENICVKSAFGGGARGNLPAGALREFLVSVPRIAALENITPMGGGTDRMPAERLERLGSRRIRHRGRAVGVRDYEELVLEHFGRAVHVKGFPGLDESGRRRSGHLCLVVMSSGLDDDRMNRELCQEIYEFLVRRCDCTLAAGGRLHVRPSVEMTVNISVQVVLGDLDLAAQTQQEILRALSELIDGKWRSREIGRQLRTDEIYSVVKAVPNVRMIGAIFVEGTWYEDGRLRVRPIERDGDFPFAAVRSGAHLVRIE